MKDKEYKKKLMNLKNKLEDILSIDVSKEIDSSVFNIYSELIATHYTSRLSKVIGEYFGNEKVGYVKRKKGIKNFLVGLLTLATFMSGGFILQKGFPKYMKLPNVKEKQYVAEIITTHIYEIDNNKDGVVDVELMYIRDSKFPSYASFDMNYDGYSDYELYDYDADGVADNIIKFPDSVNVNDKDEILERSMNKYEKKKEL